MKITKRVESSTQSSLHISFPNSNFDFLLEENSCLVDGIGGVVWDGSILTMALLEELQLKEKQVIELGCGTGICGIFTAFKEANVVLTDREIDLAIHNVDSLTSSSAKGLIECQQLIWGGNVSQIPKNPHLILVCECACLVKQQELLVQSLTDLAGRETVILVTFDGPPPPNNGQYEIKFNALMRSRGFLSRCISHSKVDWIEEYPGEGVRKLLSARVKNLSLQPSIEIAVFPSEIIKDSTEHHLVVYYLPTATNTCCRCHCQYLSILNTLPSPSTLFFSESKECRYHPGYYVCRRHPGETRLSIDGLGDSLGYYGNGQEGWPAKFWDCCGSEDPSCPGCSVTAHTPYS